ncbi:MAG: cation diffusion facilitator family transporter, partial [Lachnospiraceae bacterium]|nr:cation diffusion facilitator family transporter [Lachnospiraceae bacterium]
TTQNSAQNDALIARVSAVSIAGNVFLSAFKLIAGLLGRSTAMVSDAVHSLSDVVSTVIALMGVRIAKKGADAGHPYGHERFECISSEILAGLLLVTGLGIGMSGMRTILGGNYDEIAVPGILPLAAAVVSIVSKEGMFRYTRSCAKKLNSSAFMADAWHHRSDAFSSIGSLIGIAGARAGLPVLDSAASVVICIFIIKVAVEIFMDATRKLTDTACDEDYTQQVHDFIAGQEGVRRIDLLQTRMFGEKVYVDVEIAVDAHMDLENAHAIAECVHRGLEETFENIKHVMVHVNPYEPDTSESI